MTETNWPAGTSRYWSAECYQWGSVLSVLVVVGLYCIDIIRSYQVVGGVVGGVLVARGRNFFSLFGFSRMLLSREGS